MPGQVGGQHVVVAVAVQVHRHRGADRGVGRRGGSTRGGSRLAERGRRVAIADASHVARRDRALRVESWRLNHVSISTSTRRACRAPSRTANSPHGGSRGRHAPASDVSSSVGQSRRSSGARRRVHPARARELVRSVRPPSSPIPADNWPRPAGAAESGPASRGHDAAYPPQGHLTVEHAAPHRIATRTGCCAGVRQHSMTLTARPPSLVSLYLCDMSMPVWRIVSTTVSSET